MRDKKVCSENWMETWASEIALASTYMINCSLNPPIPHFPYFVSLKLSPFVLSLLKVQSSAQKYENVCGVSNCDKGLGSERSSSSHVNNVLGSSWPWVGKAYTDGAFSNAQRKAGVGAILRTQDGMMLGAMAVNLPGGGSPLMVELKALREALSWTSVFYRGPITIEMDCLEAINSLRAGTCSWAIEERKVLEDCWKLATEFSKVIHTHTQ